MSDGAFKDYPINLLLAGLFILAIVGFGVGLAHNYGEDESLMKGADGSGMDFSRLEQQVNQTSADANKWSSAFKSDNLFVVAGGIVLYSVWGIGKLMLNSVIVVFTIISDGATSVLGIPPIVTGVILAILIISLIFSLWRVIRAGW
jgi:hypothetical protein